MKRSFARNSISRQKRRTTRQRLTTRECDRLRRRQAKCRNQSFHDIGSERLKIDIDAGINLIQGHVLKTNVEKPIYDDTDAGVGFVKQNLHEEQFDFGVVSLFLNFKPGFMPANKFCDEFRMCFVNYTGLCVNYLAILVFSLYSVFDKETVSEFLVHARCRIAKKERLEDEIVKRGSSFLLYHILEIAIECSIELWTQKGRVSPMEYRVICNDTHTIKHDWLCFLFTLYSSGDLSCGDMKDAECCLRKMLHIEFNRSSLKGFWYEDIHSRNLAKIIKSEVLLSSVLSKFIDLKEADILGGDGFNDDVMGERNNALKSRHIDDEESADEPDDYTEAVGDGSDDDDLEVHGDSQILLGLGSIDDDDSDNDRGDVLDNNSSAVTIGSAGKSSRCSSFTLDEKKKVSEIIKRDGKMEDLLALFTRIIYFREISAGDPLKFFDLLRTMESDLIKDIQSMLYCHYRQKACNFYNVSPEINLALDYGLPLLRKQPSGVNFCRFHIFQVLLDGRNKTVEEILSSRPIECTWLKRKLHSIRNIKERSDVIRSQSKYRTFNISRSDNKRNSKPKVLVEYVNTNAAPSSTRSCTSYEVISSSTLNRGKCSKVAEWLPVTKEEFNDLLMEYLVKYDWPNMSRRVTIDDVIRKSFLYLPTKYFGAWKNGTRVLDEDTPKTKVFRVRGIHEIVRCVKCMLKTRNTKDNSLQYADRNLAVHCINKTFKFLRKFAEERVWDIHFGDSSVTFHYRDSTSVTYFGWLLYVVNEKHVMLVNDLNSFAKTFHYMYDLRKYCNNTRDALVINAAGQRIDEDSQPRYRRRKTQVIQVSRRNHNDWCLVESSDWMILQRIQELSRLPRYQMNSEVLPALRCYLIYVKSCKDHENRCPCVWSVFEEIRRVKFRRLEVVGDNLEDLTSSGSERMSLGSHTLIVGSLKVAKLKPFLRRDNNPQNAFKPADILKLIRAYVTGNNWSYELNFPSGCKVLIANGILYSYPSLCRDQKVDCTNYTIPMLRKYDRSKRIKKADWILDKDVAFFEEETDPEDTDSDNLFCRYPETELCLEIRKRKARECRFPLKKRRGNLITSETTKGTGNSSGILCCASNAEQKISGIADNLPMDEMTPSSKIYGSLVENNAIDEDLLCDYIDTYKIGFIGNLKLNPKKVVFIPLQSEDEDFLKSALISSTYSQLSFQTKVVFECVIVCCRRYFQSNTASLACKVLNITKELYPSCQDDKYLQEMLTLMKEDTCTHGMYVFLQMSAIWVMMCSPLLQKSFPVVCLRDFVPLWSRETYMMRYSVNESMSRYHESSVGGEKFLENFIDLTLPFCEYDQIDENVHKKYICYVFQKLYDHLTKAFVSVVSQLRCFDGSVQSDDEFNDRLMRCFDVDNFDVRLNQLMGEVSGTVAKSEKIDLHLGDVPGLGDKVVKYPGEIVTEDEVNRRLDVLRNL